PSRRRHTSLSRDWSSDVCSSDLRKVLERAVPADEAGSALGADARDAGVAVGRIADQREVVGNELGIDAEFLAHARGIEGRARARSEEPRGGRAGQTRAWR